MIERVVIVGGGTAGWMTAAALARAFGPRLDMVLVESDRIGTVGVGEATVPSFREFNHYLGLDEDALARAVGGTFKLGIEFVGWNGPGSRYFHPFGFLGPDMAGAEFHHVWLRHQAEGGDGDLAGISAETAAARAGRFAHDTRHGPLHHAMHIDAGRYARLLRDYAEQRGVRRIEGEIVEVLRDPGSGDLTGVALRSGERVAGDLFVDCSGFIGLLIARELGVPYQDWTHWLPCDRAVALPSERLADPPPFTRATAHEAGWQWRIPLQQRTGNGHVYCSAFLSDDDAVRTLEQGLESPAVAAPNQLRFRAGRREAAWAGNCVAIGLSGGFVEPLESTSIHLIQTAIIRLLALFPRRAIDPRLVDRYNRETAQEQDAVRDFVLAHYVLSAGHDTPFWRAVRDTPPPDSLAAKIEAFRETGTILYERGDLFGPSNWYAILTGQGVRPRDYHPLADTIPAAALQQQLLGLRRRAAAMLAELPSHRNFIAGHRAADQGALSSATTS